jgi:hypothetical protein
LAHPARNFVYLHQQIGAIVSVIFFLLRADQSPTMPIRRLSDKRVKVWLFSDDRASINRHSSHFRWCLSRSVQQANLFNILTREKTP